MIAPALTLPQVVRCTPGPLIDIAGLLPVQDAWVRRFLSCPNGRKGRASRYGGLDEPDMLTGYAAGANGSILIAPGSFQGVCRGLRAQWPGVTIQSSGSWPEYERIEFPYSGETRDYQAPTMMALRNYPRGLVVGPCGSGKMDMAIQAVRHHAMRALVIVSRDALRDDWCKRIKERTGLDVWKFGGGRKARPERIFCVATYQGLRADLKGAQALGPVYGTVIIDEADEQPATTFVDGLRFLPGVRRYGFTATPDREDGLTPLMYWWIGPEIARIERDVVEEIGAVMRPDLTVITTPFAYTYDPDDVRDDKRLNDAMYMDRPRLEVIVKDILARMPTRFAGVVHCNSIRYQDMIAGEMVRRGFPQEYVAIVNRLTKKKDRREIFAKVAKGEVRVLICTSLAERGLDIPPLDICWMVTPMGSAVKTEQKWGRIARPSPGKLKPVIVEVVDPHVTREVVDPDGSTRTLRKFVSQFRRRMVTYKSKTDFDKAAIAAVLAGRDA